MFVFSQGVNLNIIVKDPSLYVGGDAAEDHPVIASIKKLSACLQELPHDNHRIEKYLDILHEECYVDLARRCLAGTNGAYPVVYQTLDTFQGDIPMLISALKSLCSLTNGQPDLIDSPGKDLLIRLLETYSNFNDSALAVPVLEFTVRAIRFNCVKHEGNRVEFIEFGLIKHLSELLFKYKAIPQLVKELCSSLRSLTLDDDVRVPFGKAHENAKTIVTEGDALKAILSICEGKLISYCLHMVSSEFHIKAG